MKPIGRYTNGNYSVMIFEDGTKIRRNNLDYFEPEFPESMDIKITNKCDMGCSVCYEDSCPNGKEADLTDISFLDSIHPYTELAIGGGNPFSHSQLLYFLEELKKRKIIANITINQNHLFKNPKIVENLLNKKLIHGLGISLTDVNNDLINFIKKYPNSVIHIINGIVTLDQLNDLADKNVKILILGYKEFGRGVNFIKSERQKVERNKKDLYNVLPSMLEHYSVISFDNLAIKQLDPKRLMTEEKWKEFYMGDDGKFTMYVDLVNKKFAKSSVSTNRYDITDNIVDMFNIVRSENNATV